MKTIGKIIIAFASLNTILTLFRFYYYFFTGFDITPLSTDNAIFVTIGMVVVSLIAYLVGAFMYDEGK